MHYPVEIVLRGIPPSSALEHFIGEEARKLDSICDRIVSCQAVAEALQREKQQGAQFAVRLIVTLPGTEVVVNREHGDDAYMAVRDAFAAAGLQLKDHMRRLDNVERRSRNGTPNPGS
jgi:ribosome-associated translation inhibitor RaiA